MRFHRFELRKANGNLSNTVAGVLGDWSYTYDAQNRLIRATGGPSSVVAEFYYDAGNRCVKRVINGVTTYLIYDGWSLLEERNLAGNLLARYYHGPVIDELLCRVTETNTVYFHHDGLGSTVALTDSTGNVVESYTYDVYGQPSILSTTYHLLPTSSVTNRFLFTGREYLAELALYDYRHRIYSPSLGRFLQTDPLRFDAEDVVLYTYVFSNPVNMIDDFGLEARILFIDGCKKKAETIEELLLILEEAKPGSIDAIFFLGHGNSTTQDLGNNPNTQPFVSKGGVTLQNGIAYFYQNAGNNQRVIITAVADVLRNKFHTEGGQRIGLLGCQTAHGESNITKAMSEAVPGVTVYGNPSSTVGAFTFRPDRLYFNGKETGVLNIKNWR